LVTNRAALGISYSRLSKGPKRCLDFSTNSLMGCLAVGFLASRRLDVPHVGG
jgi:hypothetical protein